MLKILVATMGILILAGIVVIGTTVVKRLQGLSETTETWEPLTVSLAADERLADMTGIGERLALYIKSPIASRIVIVDSVNGHQLGEILLKPSP